MKTKFFTFVLFSLFLLAGCKAGKPLLSTSSEVKTEEHVKKDIVASTKEKQSEQSSVSEIKTVDEEEKTVTKKTEYDTDKPVDPATGKPPVKSETTAETTKNRREETKSDENITKNAESGSNTTDKSNIDTNGDRKETAAEESPKDPYRYRYIFYTVTGIIVVILGIAFCKYFKK
jgi:hypothetical protein